LILILDCYFFKSIFKFIKTGMNQEANGDLILNGDGADVVRLDQRRVVIQVTKIR